MDDRRLLLIRHARAVDSAATDRERRLTPRGRRDAQGLGGRLRDMSLAPDLVLCSTAERTRQTWDAIAAALPAGIAVEYHDDLYGGSVGPIMDRVRQTADGCAVVAVVAHNPGISAAARTLSAASDPRLDRGLPTCGTAVFAVDQPWSGLERGRLLDLLLV